MTVEKLARAIRVCFPTCDAQCAEEDAKKLLAALEAEKQPQPEPQPKTPGQVAYEAFYAGIDIRWVDGPHMSVWHRAAAAVIAYRDAEIKKALGITEAGDIVDILIADEWSKSAENTRLRNKLSEIMKVVR